jgi:hypothetical protein
VPHKLGSKKRTYPVEEPAAASEPDIEVITSIPPLSELTIPWTESRVVPADAQDEDVIRRVIAVIGDEPEAMRWLGTPVRALDYATPISLLHDLSGRNAVLAVLGRIEHGIL